MLISMKEIRDEEVLILQENLSVSLHLSSMGRQPYDILSLLLPYVNSLVEEWVQHTNKNILYSLIDDLNLSMHSKHREK